MQDMFDQAQRMARFWTDLTARMMSAGMSAEPDATPVEAAKQVRSAGLRAWSQTTEEMMRSPQFLQVMRQVMENAINWREQVNDLFTRAHHATQGVARQDIDTIVLSVKQLQTRMLSRLDELDGRLDRIDDLLAELLDHADDEEKTADGTSNGAGAARGGRARGKAGVKRGTPRVSGGRRAKGGKSKRGSKRRSERQQGRQE